MLREEENFEKEEDDVDGWENPGRSVPYIAPSEENTRRLAVGTGVEEELMNSRRPFFTAKFEKTTFVKP